MKKHDFYVFVILYLYKQQQTFFSIIFYHEKNRMISTLKNMRGYILGKYYFFPKI